MNNVGLVVSLGLSMMPLMVWIVKQVKEDVKNRKIHHGRRTATKTTGNVQKAR